MPEPHTALTLPNPLSAHTQLPHCPSVGLAPRLEAKQRNNNVVNRDEEASVGEHSQEASVQCWENEPETVTEKPQCSYNVIQKEEDNGSAKDLPEPSVAAAPPEYMPALPTQAASLHEPLDEPQPPVETMARQNDQSVIRAQQSRGDMCSPKTETAQRQSEETPSRGVEGVFLT